MSPVISQATYSFLSLLFPPLLSRMQPVDVLLPSGKSWKTWASPSRPTPRTKTPTRTAAKKVNISLEPSTHFYRGPCVSLFFHPLWRICAGKSIDEFVSMRFVPWKLSSTPVQTSLIFAIRIFAEMDSICISQFQSAHFLFVRLRFFRSLANFVLNEMWTLADARCCPERAKHGGDVKFNGNDSSNLTDELTRTTPSPCAHSHS